MKQIIFDDWTMILQTGDGGDTAANMGTYHLFLETLRRMGEPIDPAQWRRSDPYDFQKALMLLRDRDHNLGLYRRHPEPTFWGSRTNTMSRDQTIPLLAAMALFGLDHWVGWYVKEHAKRGFLFTTNTTPNWTDPVKHPAPADWTWLDRLKFFFGKDAGRPIYATKLPDITGPEFWALELRGLFCNGGVMKILAWPAVFFLDWWTVVGSLTKVFSYAKDPSNSDDRNHVNTMLVGLQVMPTFPMRLAAKIYSSRPWAGRIDSFGQITMGEIVSGPQSALDHYYRAGNSPPFNELARPIMKKYFEGK